MKTIVVLAACFWFLFLGMGAGSFYGEWQDMKEALSADSLLSMSLAALSELDIFDGV